MRVRLKIVLVVLPLLLVTLILSGASAVFSSTNGITRVTQEFLDFKAGELQKHAESQWALLLDNGFTNRSDMVSATQSGIMSFAASLIRTDTEMIIAVGEQGAVEASTVPFDVADPDRQILAGIFEERNTSLLDFELNGEERIGKGFYFAPFNLFYLVTETRDVFYRDVDRIIRESAIILAGAVLISVIMLLIFSSQLTRPISNIVTSMRKIISSNDLSERVPVQFKDETGDLAHTFNIMIGELDRAYQQIKSYAYQAVLAQKKESKIRNIFQKYVPQQLIDRFFQNPESMLIGENRELAILFSDIRSFTSISESMQPDDLVNSLNSYFSVMVDLIMNRNGIIDKYIGDAIMAFFGAPVHYEDDAFQAVMAGIEMTEQVKVFNKAQVEAGKPEFKIGVGINYGEVTVGNIGTEKKMDYTVIGDMVNLASRLEGLTKPYQQDLIIAESLFPYVDGRLPWRLLDSVAVKGKKTGVKIYTTARTVNKVEERAWDVHNRAMDTYYRRDFAGAIEGFEQVIRLLSGDANAEMLKERCQRYVAAPPPRDWDGVEVLTTK
ncbi:MAG: adenylate/guanylate cyclase domain-containing protein [Alkalispirochaeta sp.]